MKHLMFAITKTYNRVKWRVWQKKHVRQMMICQLWMQFTLGTFHFGELSFIVVCSAKHAHYLLSESDKVGESSRWKHVVLLEIEDVATLTSNFLNTENQGILSAVVMILLHSQYEKVKRKFWKLDVGLPMVPVLSHHDNKRLNTRIEYHSW